MERLRNELGRKMFEWRANFCSMGRLIDVSTLGYVKLETGSSLRKAKSKMRAHMRVR